MKQLAEVEGLREEKSKEFVSICIDPSGRSQKNTQHAKLIGQMTNKKKGRDEINPEGQHTKW